jgi:ketosteroid isomerase-like protein
MKGTLFALCALLACSVFTGEAVADDAADIAGIAQKVLDAYNSGDVDGIFKHIVAGSEVFGATGRPLVTTDKEGMQAIFDAGAKYDFEWRDFETEVYGESAVSTAFLDGTITEPDGSQIQGPWRSTTVWVEDGGKWKVVHYHVSQLLPDEAGAEALIARYHKAVEERDAEATLACLGDTYVLAGRTPQGLPGDPARWQGGVLDAAGIAERMAGLADPDATYTNSLQFIHTSVDEKTGVVVTRETGSQTSGEQSGEWEGVVNIWWVVKADGAWKIAGSLHNVQD